MSLASKLLLNKNVFHNTNYNLIYYTKNKKIHNQSYILLNTEYTNLKKEYKNIHNELNELILKLKKDNNKLLEENQQLKNQLRNNNRFINLNLHSSNPFSKFSS